MFQLTEKTKIILSCIALSAAFATGRYSVNAPAIKTVENITTTADKTKDQYTHTKETITQTKAPDGTVKTVTQINMDVTAKSDEKDSAVANIQQTVMPQKTGAMNISALVSEDFSKGLPAPAYGASISKEVLGPIRVGVFGLTTGVVGVSIGLDF